MKDTLRGFTTHGVEFSSSRGNQEVGTCPFCNKANHFYVNTENRLWDCKRCGLRGNFNGFLEEMCKVNMKRFNEKQIKGLAIDRGLPRSAFNEWEFGWNGRAYTLPVRNFKGTVEDLRVYRPGQKTQATSGATLGLLGAHHLYRHPEYPVYICEGEWDTIALVWLFRKLAHKGSVVGVPGASIFKQPWVSMFQNRTVHLLYDHDEAGENGRRLAFSKLKGVAKSIKVIEWPSTLPTGWDIRDMIKEEAIKQKKPRYALRKIHQMMVEPFEKEDAKDGKASSKVDAVKGFETSKEPMVAPEEVFESYKKWLYLKDDEPLRVLFGATFANRLQGDPLWLFLVAPPGGMKSELLMSLSKHQAIEATTSLTPHTLISGMQFPGGGDPSLLPKLNGRILVVKDFTTILTMHFSSRDEIFGVLRDCYDGKTEKIFGNGLRRSYASHFGILAGVTPAIESFGVVHQSLGERFLKYRLPFGDKNMTESDKIRRALSNINQEVKMREDLCAIGNRVLNSAMPDPVPTIPEKVMEWIIHLAQCCAMMRGVVERDRFTQQVNYKPAIEIGTRLAKQMAKLSIGIAIYLGKQEVDFEIYDLVRRVALDTAPDRVEEVVRRIWEFTPHKDDALKTIEVSQKTRLPTATIFRILQDLELLRLVDRVGKGNKYEWRLSEKLKRLIEGGRIYAPAKPRA